MPEEQDELIERLTELLSDRDVRKVRMFGGVSFMVDNRMVVAASRDGSLLVRIDPARHAGLIRRPEVQPAIMGADRPMGPGWISVSAAHSETDEHLRFWVQLALDHHAAG